MQHMRSFVECRTCELTNKSLGFDGPISSDVQFLYAVFNANPEFDSETWLGAMIGYGLPDAIGKSFVSSVLRQYKS